MGAIRASFAGFGYREIETPATEELGRLISGDSGDNQKLIFKILKRGLSPDEPLDPATAADLGLRFDLTVPLSRFYATHRGELPDVFRSIQIAPVWRAERPQKGRYRQFTQCDIDVIGEASTLAEIELVTATTATLDRLGIEGTTVRINDRKVLAALLDECGFAPADHPGTLVTVDKLDKIGLDGVAAELAASGAGRAGEALVGVLEGVLAGFSGTGLAGGAGIAGGAVSAGGAVLGGGAVPAGGAGIAGGAGLGATGLGDTVLDRLPGKAAAAADDLRSIRAGVAAAAPVVRLAIDPTLVRGQGYYTGPIFEVVHPAFSGSVAGGGRYDGMIGRFAGRDVPACGFSIGFERVVELVDPKRFASGRSRLAVVYDPAADPGAVVAWQRRLIDEGTAEVRLVRRIRNQGRMLDELAAEGCRAYLDLPADVSVPLAGEPVPELRPIRPAAASRAGEPPPSAGGV